MKVLVLAEHNNQTLAHNTAAVVAAALQLTTGVDLLIAGEACQTVAIQASQLAGVQRVYFADAACYGHGSAENISALLHDFTENYSHLFAAASQYGKNILPRVAARLDVSQISEVIAIHSADTFERPIYAGNIIAKVQSHDRIKVLTVRPTSFAAVGSQSSAEIVTVAQIHELQLSEFVSRQLTNTQRPELTVARIVVAGGRGLKNAENFKLIEQLADLMGAAIGASRAAVDAGFVPNDYQVGQTGKVVAPELYIAVGISGAIQHIAGIKDSKVIVAINKDKNAPIFQIADYGIVGDLFEVLPELHEQLRQLLTQ